MSEQQRVLAAPAYEQAYLKFFQRAIDAFVAADDVLGDIESVATRHVGPRRNVRGEKPLDQPMQEASAPSTLTFDDIRRGDIDAHTVMVFETTSEMIGERTKGFFANLAAVSDAAGMTVHNRDGMPAIEQMREMLRRMDLEFDENGKLSENIKLYVAPEAADAAKALVAAALEDPECVEIVAKKRQEWFARRATERPRKLR
jgi:hypothetical protein